MMTDAIKPTTETGAPNLSTEHQRDGDARRPSDTLDRGQADADPASALNQEDVDDRLDVSTVTPEDYPLSERSAATGR